MVIRALEKQTHKPDEIILIDDGSLEENQHCLENFIIGTSLPITLLKNDQSQGPASARNRGIHLSKGDLILLINDDTIPSSTSFIESHLIFSKKFPDSAILGKLAWHPETPNSMLCGHWTSMLGMDVGYEMAAGEILSHYKFCTANICIPRKFFDYGLFDEDFPFAALEDTELGYRFFLKGLSLRYNPDGCVLHYHAYTPEMLADRQKNVGTSLHYLLKKHPSLYKEFKSPLPLFLWPFLQTFFNFFKNSFLYRDLNLFILGITSKYIAYRKALLNDSPQK